MLDFLNHLTNFLHAQNFPIKENKDISFFKSNKDKDNYYQGLANYVKNLVDFIYSEMIRNLREYIPKATGNFFIKSLKTNMNFYLLQYISKNPEMCDDLEEDQDVAQKRAYYIDAQKKFKKINKAIGVDEQLSKYFKEDNTKVIENILTNEIIKASINKEKGLEKKENNKAVHLTSGGTDISGKKKKKNLQNQVYLLMILEFHLKKKQIIFHKRLKIIYLEILQLKLIIYSEIQQIK